MQGGYHERGVNAAWDSPGPLIRVEIEEPRLSFFLREWDTTLAGL